MSRSFRNILFLVIIVCVVTTILVPYILHPRPAVSLRIQNQTGEPVEVLCWHDTPDSIVFTFSVNKDETIDLPWWKYTGTNVLWQFPTSYGFTWKGETSGKELEGNLIKWSISPAEDGSRTVVLTKKDIVILRNK